MIEKCAGCKTDYAVTPENAGVVVFLGYLPASHVLATCSHCHKVEVIYCTPSRLADLTKDRTFGVVIQTEPPAARREAADVTWARYRAAHPQPEPEVQAREGALPELPREWLRQLHDDLRSFGRMAD